MNESEKKDVIPTTEVTTKVSVDNTSLQIMLKEHFNEDTKNFGEIKKNQHKYEELLKINGEQLSYFNKNLIEMKDNDEKHRGEVKGMLIDQNRVMATHIGRVEPVIVAYEKEVRGREYIDEKGEVIIKWSKRIGAVTIIGGAVVWFIRKFL